MTIHSKTYCIIPARGGSKRIPYKNIKNFLGKPLISYSIACAKKIGVEVIVSTDCPNIAAIAEAYGANVPFLRDHHLADDFTPTLDVILDVIKRLNLPLNSKIITLYPTAPLLSSQILIDALQEFQEKKPSYVFSATNFDFTPYRGFSYENKKLQMLFEEHINTRSQDLPTLYHDAGQFYIGLAQTYVQKLPIFSPTALPYFLSPLNVQDIDTLEDLALAEMKYKVLYEN